VCSISNSLTTKPCSPQSKNKKLRARWYKSAAGLRNVERTRRLGYHLRDPQELSAAFVATFSTRQPITTAIEFEPPA
jgi:hypothetical protein